MGTTQASVPDHNAAKVAQLYILIEFQKMFSDVTDEKFWNTFEKSLAGLESRTDASTFWGLLSGVSEAVRLNGVHQYLTNSSYSWNLEKVPLTKIMLTGMGPVVDPITLDLCERDPLKFKQEWDTNTNVRKTLLEKTDISTELRTHYPIIVFEQDGQIVDKDASRLAVFDGMHRTLANIISGSTEVEAWVGRITTPGGKPLINSQMSMLLWKIWKNSEHKDDQLKASLRRMAEEILAHYGNGRESLLERVVGWSRDDDFKNIFEEL